MKFSEYIFMALKDLWRRKGRTILTCLGITIGTLLIITLVGLGTGFNKFINDFVNSSVDSRTIGVANINYLTEDEINKINEENPEANMDDYHHKIDDNTIDDFKKIGDIEYIAPYITYYPDSISIDNKEAKGSCRYVGYRQEDEVFSNSAIENVRKSENNDKLNPIKYGRYNEKAGEVIVTEDFLKNLKINPNEAVNKDLVIKIDYINKAKLGTPISKSLKIVGVIDKKLLSGNVIIGIDEDVAYLLGASTLQDNYLENNGYDGADIITKEVSDVKPVCKEIKELNYYYQSAVDMAKSIDDTLGSISIGLAILGIVVIFVAAIGIINTMSMSVMERTKSIGVMKSVGANSKCIKTIFLVQSAVIGLIGGLVGILLGSGINSLVQHFVNEFISKKDISMAVNIGMPWYLVVGTLVFAMGISLIAGIYPASKAAKLDPIEALRR